MSNRTATGAWSRRGFVSVAGAATLAGSVLGIGAVRATQPQAAGPSRSAEPAERRKPQPARPSGPRPNIVVIMADDLGYSDIGAYGSEIQTPNLDRLARGGTRFTGATNNARCCPTRASVLTGLYPTQAGVGHMMEDEGTPEYQGRLGKSCHTIGEVLGEAGYHTAYYGKWHVGSWATGVIPASRGFDQSYGMTGGGTTYYRPTLYRDDDVLGRPTGSYYFTDDLTDKAVDGIGALARSDEPFVAMVSYSAPHWPLHAREKDIAPYRKIYRQGWDRLRRERFRRQRAKGLLPNVTELPSSDQAVLEWDEVGPKDWQVERMAVYAAQVTVMDRGIGRILDELDRRGVTDDTMVMFLSDNGGTDEQIGEWTLEGVTSEHGRRMRPGNDSSIMPGPSNTFASYGKGWASVSNTPFREYKSWTEQGGMAMPLIVSWPGKVAKGKIEHRFVHVLDLMPTLIDVAGAKYPSKRRGERVPLPEGRSLAPFLRRTGDADAGRWNASRVVCWEHEGHKAARKGKWKLVASRNEPWRLFDLDHDGAEQVDLAMARPDKVVALIAEWEDWADRVGIRTWVPGHRYRVGPRSSRWGRSA